MRTKTMFSGLLGVALVGLCLLVSGPPAQGQVTPPVPELATIAVTNNVPNNSVTTENLGGTVDCTGYKQVGLLLKFQLNAAGTTACSFTVNRSADGTNWNTTGQVLALPPSGTTFVATNAIIDMGPLPYMKISAVTAGNNSAAMTNITAIVVKKKYPLDETR